MPDWVLARLGSEGVLAVHRDLAHRPTGRSRRRREVPKGPVWAGASKSIKRRQVLHIASRSRQLVRLLGWLELRLGSIEDRAVSNKLEYPWPERNKEPILEVFRRVLPSSGTVLEVGSGSGQHAAFFAEQLPTLSWIPSDIEPENLASIREWRDEADHPNLFEPIRLDVLADDWGIDEVEVVFSANMVHIAAWECCLGLLEGARRHVTPGGLLVLYGPFRIGGEHTAPSNTTFDESLRKRDSSWGIRDLEAVRDAAEGFVLEERVEMPANNQTLICRRN